MIAKSSFWSVVHERGSLCNYYISNIRLILSKTQSFNSPYCSNYSFSSTISGIHCQQFRTIIFERISHTAHCFERLVACFLKSSWEERPCSWCKPFESSTSWNWVSNSVISLACSGPATIHLLKATGFQWDQLHHLFISLARYSVHEPDQ